jgi:hypothetical protein
MAGRAFPAKTAMKLPHAKKGQSVPTSGKGRPMQSNREWTKSSGKLKSKA